MAAYFFWYLLVLTLGFPLKTLKGPKSETGQISLIFVAMVVLKFFQQPPRLVLLFAHQVLPLAFFLRSLEKLLFYRLQVMCFFQWLLGSQKQLSAVLLVGIDCFFSGLLRMASNTDLSPI